MPHPARARWFILGLALAFGGAEGICQATRGRVAVPDSAAQAESELAIRRLLKDGFANANSVAEKRLLARELHQLALETEYDLVGRYVALKLGQDLCEQARDTGAALTAAREIARGYEVDDLALEQGILRRALEREGAVWEFLAEEALILMDRASQRDKFGIAMEMATLAEQAGVPGERYKELIEQVRSRQEAFQEIEASLQALDENPNDPQPNLAVGEYQCFIQGNWDEGLPLLVKGGSADLERIARLDLRAPVRPAAQYRLARDWWRLAESRPENEARVIRTRAVYWYGLCRETLGGLDRAGAVERIRAETEIAIAAARALAADGLLRVATYLLRKSTHLDRATIEGTITGLGLIEEVGKAADPGDEVLPEITIFFVPGPYRHRWKGRASLAESGAATSRAIELGLEWLKSHQDADGRWNTDEFMKHDVEGEKSDGPGLAIHDVGVTGLALLAFLGDGNTTRYGPDRVVVKKGIEWLAGQQHDTGLYGQSSAHDFIYDHVLATIAMCEAFGLSGDVVLRASAQAGIDYLEGHRNPAGVWRYQPRDLQGDTSVTGWAVMANRAAQDFGLVVNPDAMEKARAWFDGITDEYGEAGYFEKGQVSSRISVDHSRLFPPEHGAALTAVGLFSRFLLGQEPSEVPIMNRAAAAIQSKPPVWDTSAGSIDPYYWYYGTYALYQMGGGHWTNWSRELTKAVVDTIREDGNFKGSWDPVGVWGEIGGRVASTALLVLTLEAPYRVSRDILVTGSPGPASTLVLPGSRFRELRERWESREYEEVHGLHEKLERDALTDEEQLTLGRSKTKLDTELEQVMSEIDDLVGEGDYLGARTRLRGMRDDFDGLAVAAAAVEELNRFRRDNTIVREIRATEELARVLVRYPSRVGRERAALIKRLGTFLANSRYRNTKAAAEAERLLAQWR